MNRESRFKNIFWGLLVTVFLLLIPAVFLFLQETPSVFHTLLMLIPVLILIPVYMVVVGRFVYRDAAKRGMDPWLWATVAVFVPNLVGLIIYLVVRQTIKTVCIKCKKSIEKDFKICPYCGHKQESVCENCKKEVVPGWSVCPYCAHPLSHAKDQG